MLSFILSLAIAIVSVIRFAIAVAAFVLAFISFHVMRILTDLKIKKMQVDTDAAINRDLANWRA